MTDSQTDHRTGRRGGVLLETTLAVIVLGGLAVAGLSVLPAALAALADQRTRAAFDRIDAALTRHVLTRGALPCPDARDSGDGWPDPDHCDRLGLVPWQVLGLVPAVVRDGWGALVAYLPAPGLATPASAPADAAFAPLDCAPAASPFATRPTTLVLRRGEADSGSPLGLASPAFVLVSHGPNRKGALGPAPPGATPPTPRPLRPQAAAPTAAEAATLAAAGPAPVLWLAPAPADPPAPDGAPFDDRLFWRPIGGLLIAAGCGMDGPGH